MPGHQSPWMDDELRIFRASLEKFIAEEFVPRQDRWRGEHHPDRDAWRAAGKLGMLLPDVPAAYGGGGTFAYQAVVMEELAAAGVTFGAGIQGIVAQYLLAYASEEQKRRWLPAMASGELVAAIAMTEPDAGSDLAGIKTHARRAADRYVINGTKSFISNGALAGLICLAVKTDAKAPGTRGISMLLVETAGLGGYHASTPFQKVGMQEQDTCQLFFDEAVVPAENLLGGTEGQGFSQMMAQLPYERLVISVGAVAVAERAVAITTRYAQERRVFGKPLLDLQNTRFKLAECKTETTIGRIFLDHCISRFMAHELDDRTAAMAKYWLTELQCRVVDECVQLHGGYGYMAEYPIARMWTDSRVQRIYAGSNEIMKEIIGWSL